MGRWLGFVLDMLVVVYIAVHASLAIFLKDTISVEPALIAMSLNISTELAGLLQFTMRSTIEMENAMTSVQRVKEYIEIPSEPPSVLPGDKKLKEQAWPKQGAFKIHALKLKYSQQAENADFVLKGLNFEVPAGMKVGIVGRTGAGKSSIV